MIEKYIYWKSEYVLCFKKVKYDEKEISLSRCLLFEYSEAEQAVYCDIRTTIKKALFEFLKFCYVAFIESDTFKADRIKLYGEIKSKYDKLISEFTLSHLPKLGYHDMLMAHQKEVLFYFHSKKNNFMALEQGTGKTITAASLSKIWNCKRTLIVCPTIAKWNWVHDLVNTFGYNEDFFTVIDRNKKQCKTAYLTERFVVINFEQLERNEKHILKDPINHFIIDECTYVKNHNSARFKNLKKIVDANPSARISMLSGTPVQNRVNDLFAYFKLCGHPLGNSYSKFIREYTNSTFFRGGLKIIGGKNLDQLYRNTSNFMLRYLIEDCVDLPEKIVNKYYFQLGDYKEEYDRVIHQMMEEKKHFNINGSLTTLNIITAKSKLKGISELIKSIIEQGRKPVIFSSYTEPIEYLENEFKGVNVKIDGSVPSFERDRLITKFRTDDSCKVFIGQIIAAGQAINLTNAEDVIFTNIPFTSSEIAQAISRCYRKGQKNSVKVYFPIAEDSIDEYLFELVADKQSDINQVIDRGKKVINDYSNIQEKLFRKLIESYKIEI